MQNEQVPFYQRFSRKQQFLFFSIPLLLATLFQWLFFDLNLGINYPLFLIGLYIGYLTLFWERIQKSSRAGWSFLALALLLSFVFALFESGPILALNFLSIPLFALTGGFLLTGWNTSHWYDRGFIWEFFPKAFVKLLEQLPTPIRSFGYLIAGKTNASTKKQILTGLVIGLPLVFIILLLLASADAVFQAFLSDITQFIEVDLADAFIGRAILTFMAFWGLASFAWMIAANKNEEGLKVTASKPTIDSITAITILILVNIVYLLFLAIQFTYFFQGADLSFLENMTYAEYTRRGFGELVIVTLLNLSIILGFSLKTKDDTKTKMTIQRSLATLLVLATGIILYSSHLRLSLYEQAYGFTHLRVFVHAFMIYLVFCLIACGIKIWQKRFIFLQSALVIAMIIWTILSFMNIDAFITQKNIQRFHETEKLDMDYLIYNLSSDAFPTLLTFAEEQHYTVNEIVYESDETSYTHYSLCLNEAECFHLTTNLQEVNDSKWQEWNLSAVRKQKLIERLLSDRRGN